MKLDHNDMIKILKIAYEYAVWLKENGAGSTLSTFIDDFGYQENGVACMYDNVWNNQTND